MCVRARLKLLQAIWIIWPSPVKLYIINYKQQVCVNKVFNLQTSAKQLDEFV